MVEVLDKILSIYHSLSENPISDMTFDEFMGLWGDKAYHNTRGSRVFVEDIKFRISAKDYIYIDKLYIELHNRKPNLRDDELITYNKDCARLAENALTRIPWKNYI
jgi:hypothetical protein